MLTANAIDLRISRALDGCPAETVGLFVSLFVGETPVRYAYEWAVVGGAHPQAMAARFHRAGLPSPKRYAAQALLVRARILLDNPHTSIAAAARALRCSSPQAFCRVVRAYEGTTAGLWRQWSGSGAAALERYIACWIEPHIVALRSVTLAGPRRFVARERAA